MAKHRNHRNLYSKSTFKANSPTAPTLRSGTNAAGGAFSLQKAAAAVPRDSSLERLLAVIDLFSLAKPILTGEEIGSALALSRATLYRYLRVLGTAGFVAPVGSGRYCLGPRFVALDRQIRLSDPLLVHATPVMEEFIGHFNGLLLLCSHYRDKVLCIHHVASDPSIRFSMQRGRTFPMFRSAPSKAILAYLPPHQLKSLFLHEHAAIRDADCGDTWPQFRDKLKAIRMNGFYFAYGELDKELFGLSAPIFRAPGQIAGSVTSVIPKVEFRQEMLPELTSMTLELARRINARICIDTSVNLASAQHLHCVAGPTEGSPRAPIVGGIRATYAVSAADSARVDAPKLRRKIVR